MPVPGYLHGSLKLPVWVEQSELARVQDPVIRARIRTELSDPQRASPPRWTQFLGVVLISPACSFGSILVCMAAIRLANIFQVGIALVPIALIAWLLGIVLAIRFAIPFLARHYWRCLLRERLRAHGIAICITCGYDLTGNVSGRCPECGTEVRASAANAPQPQGRE